MYLQQVASTNFTRIFMTMQHVFLAAYHLFYLLDVGRYSYKPWTSMNFLSQVSSINVFKPFTDTSQMPIIIQKKFCHRLALQFFLHTNLTRNQNSTAFHQSSHIIWRAAV